METRPGPHVAIAGRIVLCTFAYLVAAAACIALAVPTGNNSPVWLPAGIALAAVLRYGRAMLAAVAAGAFLVNLYLNLMADRPGFGAAAVGAALVISAGNTLMAAAGAGLVRHGARTLRRDSALVVYGYIAVAALTGLLDAVPGGCTLALSGQIPWTGLGPVIALWWLGDLMAMLLVTPLISAWTSGHALGALRAPRATPMLALLLALTALATTWVFRLAPDALQVWAPFLLLAPVIGTAYRFGAPGGTAAAAIVASGAIYVTLAGAGPFATRDQFQSLLGLHIYLGLVAVAALLVIDAPLCRSRPADGPRPGRWPVATLALCLAITAAAWRMVTVHAEHRMREQFNAIVDLTWQQMEDRIANYRRLLMAGRAFFDASEDVSGAEWHAYVAAFDVERAFPGTLGLGYATWLRSRDEAEAFELRQRAQRPAYHIWPAPERWPVAAVTYLAPPNTANARPLGYNMLFEAGRRHALEAAIASGGIGSTGTLLLVHDFARQGQRGFLMFMPLYRHGAPTATAAQRSAALSGFIYSPFRIADMVGEMIGRRDAFTLRVIDLHPESGGGEIYDNAGGPRTSRYVKPLSSVRSLAIDESGHRWRLEFTATASFESGIDRQSPLITLGLGSMISFLLFGIVRGLASTRARALAMAREITQELQLQQHAVRQTEERFRLFTASVRSHAIIFLDEAGRVEAWNDGAANLFGHTDGEAVGRALDLWADPGRGQALLAEAKAGGSATAVTELVCKNGDGFTGELQLTAVRRDSVLTGFACIVRDVTAARQAEEQMRQAVAIAQSASRAKSAFVANMSHELRTPMNGVLGIAALLERGALDKEQRGLVQMIRSSGETLLAVLNDILDFSKIEAGKVELDPRPVALDDVALACARLMAVQGGGRLRMLVDVAPALPATIVADALRLEQILTNLIGNALKFTERGAVECRFVAGTAADGQRELLVAVADTGIGIAAPQQARLFSAFAQADNSTTRRFGGTGLGLTIARTLAELMGGTLAVDSAPGAGSTFTLTVPLQDAGASDRYALPPEHMHLPVLLCEPDTRVVSALANATARWGWHLHIAHDPARVGLLLAVPGTLPYELAIVGPGIDAEQVAAALAARRAQLPARFALIRIQAGFDAPAGDMPAPFPAAVVHAPATRAALHGALLEARRAPVAAEPAPVADDGAPPLAGMRVLLAEDNAINQTVAIALLDYAGAALTVAGDGAQAVALLERDPAGFDIVLMDVQMPVMDGLAATQAIRTTLGLTLPVVAMTAGVTQEERHACTAAGMDDFIAKPIEEDELVAVLKKYR